ncbi:IS630 family transposase [uncultured Methanospirillum sp.]|uniref:IS630 family transposase n=1 Tax=uncultured Methanospirillum sp. TaxID=262503 RepID=UPI003748FBF5
MIQKIKSGKYDVWSTDECHFQQNGTRCRMWIPTEIKNPVIKQEPTCRKISVFGTVNNQDGRFMYDISPVFSAETFLEHLKHIIQYKTPKKKILLIIDNARYHHATWLIPWLEENKRKIQLFFLQPYSPELNPVELVWKETRHSEAHNRYFPTVQSLWESITEAFDQWGKPNDKFRSLCKINYGV